MIEIYADGSCIGNPGPGAFGIYSEDYTPANYVLGVRHTTNQTMELSAVVEGLRCIPHGWNTVIFSDSQYAVGACTTHKIQANKELSQTAKRYLEKLNRDAKVSVVWQPRDSSPGNRVVNRNVQKEARKMKDLIDVEKDVSLKTPWEI